MQTRTSDHYLLLPLHELCVIYTCPKFLENKQIMVAKINKEMKLHIYTNIHAIEITNVYLPEIIQTSLLGVLRKKNY